jgi:hypothetical protein
MKIFCREGKDRTKEDFGRKEIPFGITAQSAITAF